MALSLSGASAMTPGEIDGPVESVVVVGAGMAGLTVGNALAHGGIPCTTLEARNRVGGRTFTAEVGGSYVDLGASWIHSPGENPLTALGADLGIQQVPWEAFDVSWGWDPDTGELLAAEEFGRLYALADAAVEEFVTSRRDAGGNAPLSQFVATASAMADLDDVSRARTAALVRLFVEADSSGRMEDVSSRWFPSNGLELEGSPMGDVPVGGYGRFVDALSEGLDIRTGVVVTDIEVGEEGVVVHCAGGESLSASHAVVTVPLGVLKARAISFTPQLQADRLAAVDRLGFGSFDKLAMTFDRPFWTEAGVPHLIVTPSVSPAPTHCFLGADSAGGGPVLVAFAFGSTHQWLEHEDTADSVASAMSSLEQIFGSGIPEPVAAVRSEWSRDPFSRGAYTFLAEGAGPDDLELLGIPHARRVLFAGEATGYARVGFADGAIATGIREARRLTRRPDVELGRLGSPVTGRAGWPTRP